MKIKPATIHAYGLMFIASVITVAIVTSSQILTARIGLLLERQASELLAADLVISSSREFDNYYSQQAESLGLKLSRSANFTTAIFIDDAPRLVEVKAVDGHYPLRGKLEKSRQLGAKKINAMTGPESGEVWLDAKLTKLLGEKISLGDKSFDSNWLLTYEPDRDGAIFNLAPRVMMNLNDLSATGLLVAGSRVEYRLMFSGDQGPLTDFKLWLTEHLKSGEEIHDLASARPEMRQALQRTRQFFALAIVLTLIIAMVAIAITARHTATHEASKIAMLRAFGISQKRLFKYYLVQLCYLWVGACMVGIGIGWFSQFPLQWLLDGWFAQELPQAGGVYPYFMAALVGLLTLLGFSLPHLINATSTPPMQVLRTVSDRRSYWKGLLVSGCAVISVFIVLMLLMQNSKLAVATLGIILASALVLPLILNMMVKLLLFSSGKIFWIRRYLLSRLQLASRGAIFVMSGFSLVLVAILLIALVKDELLASWQAQLPEHTPNYFLINIRSDEVKAVDEFLAEHKVESSQPYALVRARLSQINSIAIEKIKFKNPRTEHFVQHTFNISFADQLPDQNEILSGLWINSASQNQLSVEQGMAQRLGLGLGDILQLSIGSHLISAPVTSIRSVVWENFKPNFYLIANRGLIEDMPQTWLLSASINEQNRSSLQPLQKRFPSVTLLDITEMMDRIRAIVSRATNALHFFFFFAIVSAMVVLLAALQTGKHGRESEASLLRALAANSAQMLKVHSLEFALMGGLIGLLSAIIATLAGWFLSRYFFEIDYHFSAQLWAYSIISASLLLTIAGTWFSRKSYYVSPMRVLRS